MSTKVKPSSAARSPSTSPASRSSSSATPRKGACRSRPTCAAAVKARPGRLHRRRHARRPRTARPISSTSSASPREIAKAMHGYTVVVDKSTVPVGTREQVASVIAARRPSTRSASSATRSSSKEGAAVDDFLKPDRVVDRRRRPARRARCCASSTRPFTRTGAPDPGDGLRQRRADQVRRQRDARDPHLVHERGRHAVRSCTAPTSTRCAGHRRRTRASARRSCSRASATAAAAFPKDVKALAATSPRTRATTFEHPRRRRATSTTRRRRCCCSKIDAALGGARRARRSPSGAWRSSRTPTTCARRRRVTLIEGLLAAGATVAGVRPRGASRSAKPHLRRHASPTAKNAYDALEGADALVARHRVERVPRARLRAHEDAACAAGHLRRPQHLQARGDCAPRASPTTRSDDRRDGGAGHAAAPATSAAIPSRRCSRPAARSSCSTTSRPGIAAPARPCSHGRARAADRWSRPSIGDTRHGRGDVPRARRRRGDALCGVAVGGRLGARTRGLLPQQRHRLDRAARRPAPRRRDAAHLLVHLRDLR